MLLFNFFLGVISKSFNFNYKGFHFVWEMEKVNICLESEWSMVVKKAYQILSHVYI